MTETDEAKLRAAIGVGKLSVLLSVIVMSETLLMKPLSKGLDQARWILDLTRERSFVKDTDELINDAIRAYAQDRLLPTCYAPVQCQEILRER